jgi:hypothetical protein
MITVPIKPAAASTVALNNGFDCLAALQKHQQSLSY